jgi:hypothetical protein
MRVHHREPDAVARFHVLVADAGGAAIFGPSDFHPDQVVGVVHHAHLVGLGVAHAEASLVNHYFFRARFSFLSLKSMSLGAMRRSRQ